MRNNRSLFSIDIPLIGATIFLAIVGILSIYSSGITITGEVFSGEYIRQLVWVVSGLIIMSAMAFTNYGILRRYALPIFVLTCAMLIAVLVFGREVNGARSWLGIGQLGIQPSEFAKIGTILLLALYLEKGGQVIGLGKFIAAFGIMIVPVLLILLQPDLGTASVYLPIYLTMAFVAGARLRHIFYVILLVALLTLFTLIPAWEEVQLNSTGLFSELLSTERLFLLILGGIAAITVISMLGWHRLRRNYFYWIMYASSLLLFALPLALVAGARLKDYQLKRLVVFLDPYVDARGAGWNIIQSLTAIGSGGLFGKGYLQGTHSHYRYLPQQSTDFIFSIFAEEWGFIGGVIIFIAFLIILLRGIHIISVSQDRFGECVGAGVIAMIFFHFMVNVGMTMGMMPITGIPLSFLSHGGSSLWMAMIGIGLLMSIYRHRRKLRG